MKFSTHHAALFIIVSAAVSGYLYSDHGFMEATIFSFGNALVASAFTFATWHFIKKRRFLEPALPFLFVSYLCYGPGNWPLLTSWVNVNAMNSGADDYYFLTSLAAGIGLWIYVGVYCLVDHETGPLITKGYHILSPRGVVTFSLASCLIFLIFFDYFPDFNGKNLDNVSNLVRAVGALLYCLPNAAVFLTVLSWPKIRCSPFYRFVSLALVGFIGLLILGTGSRTFMLVTALTCFFIKLDQSSRFSEMSFSASCSYNTSSNVAGKFVNKKFLLLSLLLLPLLYFSVTWFRLYKDQVENEALFNFTYVIEFLSAPTIQSEGIWDRFYIDVGYRLGQLDFPSAILQSQNQGENWMFGQTILKAFWYHMPQIVTTPLGIDRPTTAKKLIAEHYLLNDMDQSDSILSSGVADFGLYGGALYFIILALFHAKIVKKFLTNDLTRIAYIAFFPSMFRWDSTIDVNIFQYLKLFLPLLLFILPFYIVFKIPESERRITDAHPNDSFNNS